jgi:hypothetical protein
MKKRDWAFVTLCLAGVIFCGIGGVKPRIDYRAHRGALDFSSLVRIGS